MFSYSICFDFPSLILDFDNNKFIVLGFEPGGARFVSPVPNMWCHFTATQKRSTWIG